jgi:hypothetical protein
MEEETLDSASRQCASSQCPHGEAVFSRWVHFSGWTPPTPPLFTGFSPLWLLPVPQTEKCVKKNSFSVCRWGKI